jgi:hypothetical protein
MGLGNHKRDFENKVYAKRYLRYKLLIPEQNFSNPNFKPNLFLYSVQLFILIFMILKFLPVYCMCAKPEPYFSLEIKWAQKA